MSVLDQLGAQLAEVHTFAHRYPKLWSHISSVSIATERYMHLMANPGSAEEAAELRDIAAAMPEANWTRNAQRGVVDWVGDIGGAHITLMEMEKPASVRLRVFPEPTEAA